MLRALDKAKNATTVPAATLRGSLTTYLDWLDINVTAAADKANATVVAWDEVAALISDLFQFKRAQGRVDQRNAGLRANFATATGTALHIDSTTEGSVLALATGADSGARLATHDTSGGRPAGSASGVRFASLGASGGTPAAAARGAPAAPDAGRGRCGTCHGMLKQGFAACFNPAACGAIGPTPVRLANGMTYNCTVVPKTWLCPVCALVNPIHRFFCSQFGCDTPKPHSPAQASAAQMTAYLPLAAAQHDKLSKLQRHLNQRRFQHGN